MVKICENCYLRKERCICTWKNNENNKNNKNNENVIVDAIITLSPNGLSIEPPYLKSIENKNGSDLKNDKNNKNK